jgi:hypothetical protein
MENETNQEFELETIETEVDTDSIEEVDTPTTDYKALYEEERKKKNKYKNRLLSLTASEKPKSEPITKTRSDDSWKARMELKVEGYDDEAIDFILKNGGKKALENPYVVQAVEAIKTKKVAEAATLGDQGQKSGIEKRFTPQEFAKLSSEEQLKALSDLS